MFVFWASFREQIWDNPHDSALQGELCLIHRRAVGALTNNLSLSPALKFGASVLNPACVATNIVWNSVISQQLMSWRAETVAVQRRTIENLQEHFSVQPIMVKQPNTRQQFAEETPTSCIVMRVSPQGRWRWLQKVLGHRPLRRSAVKAELPLKKLHLLVRLRRKTVRKRPHEQCRATTSCQPEQSFHDNSNSIIIGLLLKH